MSADTKRVVEEVREALPADEAEVGFTDITSLPPAVPETAPATAVYLVSCVGKKRTQPSAAKSLYISEWFLKARRYVEATGCPWFILSAEYGLVAPDQAIPPYERTLNTMSVRERRAWARRVEAQMNASLPRSERIVILAGQRYREFLMAYLIGRVSHVEVPLEGLRIGEQLSWLSNAVPGEGHGEISTAEFPNDVVYDETWRITEFPNDVVHDDWLETTEAPLGRRAEFNIADLAQ